jgi:hypothetical protein
MQKPVRYYITKSGEEPMVRSVKVALAAPDAANRDDAVATAPVSAPPTVRESTPAGGSVRRLVKSAMQMRSAHR